MKHLKNDCDTHHITFGGGCLNCGVGMVKFSKPTKENRIDYLKSLGFKFPKK